MDLCMAETRASPHPSLAEIHFKGKYAIEDEDSEETAVNVTYTPLHKKDPSHCCDRSFLEIVMIFDSGDVLSYGRGYGGRMPPFYASIHSR